MATINIAGPAAGLTMQDFRAISDKYGSLQKSCRFIVKITPVGQFIQGYTAFTQDLMYLCEIAEMPGRNFLSADVRYYGPNHKLPYQTNYDDVTVTILCRNQSLERQFFDDWQLIMNPINTFDFNYRDDYRADVQIYQYSDIGPSTFGPIRGPTAPNVTYMINLHDAYPINLNPQPMTWADDQFQRVVVTFTYHHWSRPGIDPTPRNGAAGGFSFNIVEGATNTRNP